jgi:hypothetical protein
MPHRPNRRTVVRTAVWTAPAVAVATAAPAMAISTNTPAILHFDTFNLFGADYVAGNPTTLESQVEVQNVFAATSPTITTVTVNVTYPDTRVSGAAPTSVTGAGWSFSSASHVGPTWVYTFVFGGSVAPGGSTTTVDFHVPLTSAAAGTIAITGSAFAAGGSTVAAATYKVK